jgi:hypothetical protein
MVAALVPAYYQDPQQLVRSVALSAPAGVSVGATATSNNAATLQIAGFKSFAGAFGVQVSISGDASITSQEAAARRT